MATFFEVGEGGLRMVVRLTPRASRDAVEDPLELADGRTVLGARVRAVPEKGAANRALQALIGTWLGVAKSRVKVVSGVTSRIKTVDIAGGPDDLAARLQARLSNRQGGSHDSTDH